MIERLCRFCRAPISRTFADLGVSPVANAFLKEDALDRMEPFFPLHAYVCETCLLVQLEDFETPDHIFNDEYAYFSSYSESWLDHARRYTEMMIPKLGLNEKSFVVEIASNDGYLLQYFMQKKIPVLGIEPSGNVAAVARDKGIESWVKFFGEETARELVAKRDKPDLMLGNNVLAHVPAINDFVGGLKIALAGEGVATFEFPHLLSLMRENQFDTIYHEHFSYFSFLAVTRIFAAHGLRIFDVERLPTHGGSLRIYAAHEASKRWKEQPTGAALLNEERAAGLDKPESYSVFAEQVNKTKRELLDFLIDAKRAGKSIVGYGAPAKGNTLLNFCGVRTDFVDYTVDKSPHKQGMYLPGVHIPIYGPDKIMETKPDYVLILPWNLRKEIVGQMSGIRAWGGKFVVPIPQVAVLEWKLADTGLAGLYVIELDLLKDDRGFFARSFCAAEFDKLGLDPAVAQCNISFNEKKGTLRGLHFQAAPHEEGKLVRCTRGAIYDVAVDIRPQSPTYGNWYAVELTADNRRMIFIPVGFAHGFQTLADNTEVFYQMTEFYHPESARGLRWDDPALSIPWPIASPLLSDKDRLLPLLDRALS